MADKKISALTSATIPLAGTEVLPIVQGGATVKVSAINMTTFMPAFSAYQSTVQSISNNTWTKVNLQTLFFDTNSNFASSRFTPTVAGYYQFNGNLQFQTAAASALVDIYKNGGSTGYRVISSQAGVFFATGGLSTLLYMNGSTDYVELYAYQATGVAVDTSTVITQFNGSMIRGA